MMIEENNNFENQEPIIAEETIDSQESNDDAYTTEDIEKGKTMAGLAYILFFLPLIVCPDSKYAKFHANQSLLLLITSIAGNVILGIIPVIGWMLIPIYGLGVLALFIMGLINGFGGKAKRLPLIGTFDILK